MSRSKKKSIVKDNYKNRTRLYHRIVRSAQQNYIRSHIHDIENENFILQIPSNHSIVNDYNYRDYRWNYEYCKGNCGIFRIEGETACKKCKKIHSMK